MTFSRPLPCLETVRTGRRFKGGVAECTGPRVVYLLFIYPPGQDGTKSETDPPLESRGVVRIGFNKSWYWSPTANRLPSDGVRDERC